MKFTIIALSTLILSQPGFANTSGAKVNGNRTTNGDSTQGVDERGRGMGGDSTQVDEQNRAPGRNSSQADRNRSTSTDNTKLNERDRASSQLTADQQKNNALDTDTTRRIRQDIMKEQNFSTYAQNVKVISVNGKVTLKGPVRSEQEQNSILNYARQPAGASNVINEMTIVTEKR